MKRTPLRRVSKKRAHDLAIYRSLKKYVLLQRYFCEYPATDGCPSCMKPATEIHHMRGRAGAMLNNVKYWLPICREHHRYLHDHGREARELGLLK